MDRNKWTEYVRDAREACVDFREHVVRIAKHGPNIGDEFDEALVKSLFAMIAYETVLAKADQSAVKERCDA